MVNCLNKKKGIVSKLNNYKIKEIRNLRIKKSRKDEIY